MLSVNLFILNRFRNPIFSKNRISDSNQSLDLVHLTRQNWMMNWWMIINRYYTDRQQLIASLGGMLSVNFDLSWFRVNWLLWQTIDWQIQYTNAQLVMNWYCRKKQRYRCSEKSFPKTCQVSMPLAGLACEIFELKNYSITFTIGI